MTSLQQPGRVGHRDCTAFKMTALYQPVLGCHAHRTAEPAAHGCCCYSWASPQHSYCLRSPTGHGLHSIGAVRVARHVSSYIILRFATESYFNISKL